MVLMFLLVIQIQMLSLVGLLLHLSFHLILENMAAVDRMNVGVGKTPWAIKHRLVAGLKLYS